MSRRCYLVAAPMGEHVGVHHQPDGAAFDIVLLLHVACVLAGLATTVTAAATATRLRRLLEAGATVPEPVRRYFRPGVNWAGRSLWGIPIFGVALLAMSKGAYDLHDAWVTWGLVLFVAVAFLAEGLLWPAERRIQSELSVAPGVGEGENGEAGSGVARDAALMARVATSTVVLLLAAMVLMIAQP